MGKEALNELLGKDLAIGYVYGYDGGRQVFYFEKSPSNVANFIMLHREHADKMIVTDLADRLILNTFGELINHCSNQGVSAGSPEGAGTYADGRKRAG